MVLFSVETMEASGVVDAVVLVVPPSELARAEPLRKASPAWRLVHDVVDGGVSRAESVRRGLAAVPASTDVVICHDAARPFASPDLFRRAFEALGRADGIVPVIPSPDTVKRLQDGRVVETIPRHVVGLAQTPQVFRIESLRSAHAQDGAGHTERATDDAMLLELAGFSVQTVEGEPENFKVTTPGDLRRAEMMTADNGHWFGPRRRQPARRTS